MATRTGSRIDYDAIAPLYDGQPHRAKAIDDELVAFIAQRGSADPLSILDVACGTGSQLVANRSIVPHARLVGLDRSGGMLRQAQSRMPDIGWIQADGAALPFRPGSFDFVTCQFGFHHVRDKTALLQAIHRVLRADGRFVMRNVCPQAQPDWLYYEYFPEARTLDLEDFWPVERIVTTMEAAGFAAVTAGQKHLRLDQDLRQWLDTVRRRDTDSQLMAISDRAYEAGIRRLERELARAAAPRTRTHHVCLLTVRGDRAR
jgi:ubiquinone/menaquinone biosynthesis C-methylase UbiE